MRRVQMILKRMMDLVISATALLFLLIPFAIIALAVKLDSKGPVFFRQERVGTDGRDFRIWKFRSMVVGAQTMGTGLRTNMGDDRVTGVGRWLRMLGIDELPQLLNVLVGEMSLVGPRPTVRTQVLEYSSWQMQRLLMRPGITGLTILRGRNRISWPARIRIDVEYVQNWSLWLDFKILLLTPWVVLVTKEGAYRPTEGWDDHQESSSIGQLPTDGICDHEDDPGRCLRRD